MAENSGRLQKNNAQQIERGSKKKEKRRIPGRGKRPFWGSELIEV